MDISGPVSRRLQSSASLRATSLQQECGFDEKPHAFPNPIVQTEWGESRFLLVFNASYVYK